LGGYVAEGPCAKTFEDELARWLGVENILTLNSGSSALHLALRLAGVGPGDEVISTPMTCIATNLPMIHLGARIRWADIDPATGNIDPADVARKINRRTRAIVVMHWGGDPCEMNAIWDLAQANGLKVVEDACHAFGSRYDGRLIGARSDFVCFSFQAVKMMTTVDGGALVCAREMDAERGRLLRWYGLDRRLDSHHKRRRRFFEQDIQDAGYKFHMNDVAAAMGIEQLKYVAANIEKHKRHAAQYREAFAGLRRVRLLDRNARRDGNDWLFTLRVEDRKAFSAHMQSAGVDVSPVHVRNDRYSIFRPFGCELPGVDAFDPEHVCIPVGWWLTDTDSEKIIQAVQDYDIATV
jgi:dTDP-4-amino-4,6-dideoxygalactose transaminase